jgi:uncharacterized membrane protein YphA (DoxX/SURF4 family)
VEQPVVALAVYAARFFLALVFIAAGASKLFQAEEFERAVANYRLLPRRFSRPVAIWLPRAELGAGFLLACGVALVPVAYLTALLLLVFSVAVGINLLRGREMSCNCFGASASEKMTWLTVGRNLVLTGIAVSVVLIPPTAFSVWPGPGGGPTAASVTAGAAIAMLIASSSAVLLVGLISQAWRAAKAGRELQRYLSTAERERA